MWLFSAVQCVSYLLVSDLSELYHLNVYLTVNPFRSGDMYGSGNMITMIQVMAWNLLGSKHSVKPINNHLGNLKGNLE